MILLHTYGRKGEQGCKKLKKKIYNQWYDRQKWVKWTYIVSL